MSTLLQGVGVVGSSAEGKFIVDYKGTAMMDSRCMYSKEMMPWVIAEILRFSGPTQVVLSVKGGRLTCTGLKGGNIIFDSGVCDCVHFFPLEDRNSKNNFVLIVRANEIYLHCRLFSASSAPQVSEVFSTMKESQKVSEPCHRSTSAPKMAISPISSDSVSFEVLYIGKLRMSFRKAPPTFIDEALEKFRAHESDKIGGGRRDSVASTVFMESDPTSSHESTTSSCESLGRVGGPSINVTEECDAVTQPSIVEINTSSGEKSSIPHPLEDVKHNINSKMMKDRTRHPSGDSALLVKSISLPVEPMRNRALSTGNYPREQVLETNRIGVGSSQSNRTMLLIVGRCEMKLISPDAKTLLFSKHFRDICQSSQGLENKEYFGFICKESAAAVAAVGSGGGRAPGGYVAYVFRCQSDSVSGDILKVLKQATLVSQEGSGKERPIQSCDHCPMVWYRQLCAEVDGVISQDRVQLLILKYIHSLCEEDRASILQKFHGAEGQSILEQNQLLMMLLRVHCEAKQVKHIHDTTENRHEFLNQFLGGGEIFTKARRSITSSLDHFIKRKTLTRELSLPHSPFPNKEPLSPLVSLGEDSPSFESTTEEEDPSPRGVLASPVVSDSPLELRSRPRSSTLGSLTGEKIRYDMKNRRTSNDADNLFPSPPKQSSSPMINLFQKMGSNPQPKSSTPSTSQQQQHRPGSWRHAIFKKVVSPTPPPSAVISSQHPHRSSSSSSSSAVKTLFRPKRTEEELRSLWKTAINQQIILIRMEKQNLRLKAKQEEADVKRLKLSYRELGVCDEEANETWDLVMTQPSLQHPSSCDLQLLNSAILRGIPKHKRGQVWQFFIQQRTSSTESNYSNYCHLNLDMTYDQLLRQLTSQQHAILIDLGRTFPTHPYFSGALGSGQLALFNILKAYSLLDTDVGYCQGLSFVAGLLLMHLEEEEAFSVLKFIMFDLGAREHYKPDMHELQVKLYQLTRLIHDQDPDLLLLLNHYDVLPSLYAAPWFLTLFASQFPIGFAVRVLDVLLLHGVDVIAKFAVMLILDHKQELMQCTGLEQVMDCFKAVVTNVTGSKLDKYLKKVLESDWDKQMLTYSVEYSVMNDEAFHAFLSESSAPTKLKSPLSQLNKSVQTSPPPQLNTAEKHPILGDLIQRQNGEIAKLQKEKTELRRDIQSLLSCILTMQKLAQISTQGKVLLPVPPEITEIGAKYFMKCGTNYGKLLENPSGGGVKPNGSLTPLPPPLASADTSGSGSDDCGSGSTNVDSPTEPGRAKINIMLSM